MTRPQPHPICIDFVVPYEEQFYAVFADKFWLLSVKFWEFFQAISDGELPLSTPYVCIYFDKLLKSEMANDIEKWPSYLENALQDCSDIPIFEICKDNLIKYCEEIKIHEQTPEDQLHFVTIVYSAGHRVHGFIQEFYGEDIEQFYNFPN